jgi:transposase
VHSRYQRRLADAAIGGRRVVLRLRVRRFFCDHPGCQARTFAAQIPGLTTRYARRSPLLHELLEAIGLTLAGRAGDVTAFAELMSGRHGDRLDAWIAKVEGDELPQLRSFAAGLKRDLAAVVSGLRLPYSSGAVEGNVNRIKMFKPQMYGRASFDLLRKRVLLAT